MSKGNIFFNFEKPIFLLRNCLSCPRCGVKMSRREIVGENKNAR